MQSPTDVLDAAQSGNAVALFQAFNPGAMQAVLAKATKYRARRGAQPLFDTPQEAEAFDLGWDGWPERPNLTANTAQWLGFCGREEAERHESLCRSDYPLRMPDGLDGPESIGALRSTAGAA